MLSVEDNELLCRVGPGTPMGELMRQYWMPALKSDRAAGAGRPAAAGAAALRGPDRLSRDAPAQVGLLANNCPHRGASLFFGRNEEDGLRCVYHGWKFDVGGRCVDMPNEPAESNFKDKVHARGLSLPRSVTASSGSTWVRAKTATAAAKPGAERAVRASSDLQISLRECNYMQALEGDIDTSHLAFLHMGSVTPEQTRAGIERLLPVTDRRRASRSPTPTSARSTVPIDAGRSGPTYWRMATSLSLLHPDPQRESWARRFSFGLGTGRTSATHVLGHSGSASRRRYRPSGRLPVADARAAAAGAGRQARNGDFPTTAVGWGGGVVRLSRQRLPDRPCRPATEAELYGNTDDLPAGPGDHRKHGTDLPEAEERLGTTDSMIIRTRQRLIRAAEAYRDGVCSAGRPRSRGLRRPLRRDRSPQRRRLAGSYAICARRLSTPAPSSQNLCRRPPSANLADAPGGIIGSSARSTSPISLRTSFATRLRVRPRTPPLSQSAWHSSASRR